jgi:hypothetical protein
MRLSAVMATSGSANKAARDANKDDHGRQRTLPDEDLNDKVVNNRNAMAEVKLPSSVCKSYLLSVFMSCHQLGFHP